MPHPHPAGQALTSRRKRALDDTNFITQDVGVDERDRTTGRVQRQRTSSTTSIETIRVRPTTKGKVPIVSLGVGKPLVALSVPKQLPPSSVGSKIPIPISTVKPTTSTTPRDDKPRKLVLKKPKLANLGAPAQSGPIVAHMPVVYHHEPFVVDDPRSRVEEDIDMDMDAIPCIPSPPDSPPLRASDAPQSSARDAQSDARDSLTSNVQITPSASPAAPTPTLAQASTSTNQIETSNSSSASVSTVKGTKKRHSNSSIKAKTPSISFPSIDAKTKEGKTTPLVALCPNTSSLHGRSSQAQGTSTKSSDSLVGIKSSDAQFKSSPPSTNSSQDQLNNLQKGTKQPQKSMAKIDTWGCVHLGAADCVLAMTFPQPHCEVWDMRDE